MSRRNEDVHQHAAIERRHVSHAVGARCAARAVLAVVLPDNPLVAALEDADDPAFGAAAVLDPLDADDDPIAVHRLVEMRARNVNVAASLERPFRGHEPIPGRMRLQPPDVQIHLLGQAKPVAANLDEIAG